MNLLKIEKDSVKVCLWALMGISYFFSVDIEMLVII